ncbi:MAG: hypothetical protein JWM45_25 [Pseudonocardiales bacterium]|nr:hypothetical protein [Pseudonocardiales bacterium]
MRSGRGPVRHTLLLLAPAGDGHPGVRNRSGCICGCIRPRSARPGSGHARAYDLPILLGWSSLIAGLTTLKASVPKGTGGSNPSASALYQHKRRDSDHFLVQRGRRWLHFWWHVNHKVTHPAARPTGWLRCAVEGSSAH